MNNLVYLAAFFARASHDAVGQRRKYTNEPYWHHTTAVAKMVEEYVGTPKMIAAAHLHDTLEDTEHMLTSLAEVFPQEVVGLVQELTDRYVCPELGNRAERKAMEAERLSTISPEAQTIKYADLIDNTPSIIKYDPNFAKVYLREVRAILEVMDKGDPELYNLAWYTINRYPGDLWSAK